VAWPPNEREAMARTESLVIDSSSQKIYLRQASQAVAFDLPLGTITERTYPIWELSGPPPSEGVRFSIAGAGRLETDHEGKCEYARCCVSKMVDPAHLADQTGEMHARVG
jgi:hypothetical protein